MPVTIVCLLPARNAAADLPGFFESAARFADAVVALDDGSTDDTAERLRSEPLVSRVITNPPRSDFRGWNDAANRNLLLSAVAAERPDWIISVDADERIPEDDAEALRAFLETDALPGVAYGFRCYSMIGDLDHALPNPIWVYRLFAFRDGERFPDQALHFAPIPTTIPRQAYLRTTFRIQHLGGVSPERRLARYEKYRQADPDCKFWPDYASLLNEPAATSIQPWKAREPGAPALFSNEFEAVQEIDGDRDGGPWLGVIVIDDGPIERVGRALDSVPKSQDLTETEVLLVTAHREIAGDREDVRIVDCAQNANPGVMRNAGLRASTAKHVLFLNSGQSLLPGALEAIADAHRIGYASVTGAVEPVTAGARQTATYISRFGGDRPRRSSTILDGAPRWASCSRTLLLEHGGFLESVQSGEEIPLMRAIAIRGHLTYAIGDPLLRYHGDSSRSIAAGASGAFRRGVANARFFQNEYADRGELLNRRFLREQLLRPLPRRIGRAAGRAKTQSNASHGPTAAIAASFEIAQWVGQWFDLARPARGKALTLFGRPGGLALVVLRRNSARPAIALARYELRTPLLKIALVPADLQIPSASGEWICLESALAESNGDRLSRFAAQDLIGRPFALDLDDFIEIDESKLPKRARAVIADTLKPLAPSSDPPKRLTLSSCWALWSAFVRGQGAVATLSRRAMWLALLRLRVLDSSNLAVMALPGGGANLDAELVEMAHTFLDIESIHRPSTRHNQLKQVEWA